MSDTATRSAKLPPAWFKHAFWRVHRGLHRLSGGRLLWTPASRRGWGALHLTTIGRRSGRPRGVIVGYLEDGPNLVVMAMNGWDQGHPAWWLNLEAHPDAVVRLSGQPPRAVHARTATGAERERLWERWRAVDTGLDDLAALRTIETPVVVFEPRKDDDGKPTMRAVTQRRYGPPDVLEYVAVPAPVVGDGDVLVRVHAAAVHLGDYFVMTGVPYLMRIGLGLRRPHQPILGRDVAGVVEAVGKDVTSLAPGTEVLGWSTTGTLAEYVSAPADHFVPKPPTLSWEQAAAVPTSASAALQALRDVAHVRPGQSVLVTGASGGVGTFAVQIAKTFGAEVTGVCSSRNLDLVRSLGADHVIDYAQTDVTRTGQRYDVILDNVEAHSLPDIRRVLAPAGTLIPNSGRGGRWLGPLGRIVKARLLSLFTRQSLHPFLSRANREDLLVLCDLAASGRLTPVIDRTYPLQEAAQALRHVGAGHTRGKSVITP